MINSLKKGTKLTMFLLVCFLFALQMQAQNLAILKYKGGGDWYSNPTALPNLIKFMLIVVVITQILSCKYVV